MWGCAVGRETACERGCKTDPRVAHTPSAPQARVGASKPLCPPRRCRGMCVCGHMCGRCRLLRAAAPHAGSRTACHAPRPKHIYLSIFFARPARPPGGAAPAAAPRPPPGTPRAPPPQRGAGPPRRFRPPSPARGAAAFALFVVFRAAPTRGRSRPKARAPAVRRVRCWSHRHDRIGTSTRGGAGRPHGGMLRSTHRPTPASWRPGPAPRTAHT